MLLEFEKKGIFVIEVLNRVELLYQKEKNKK
jgi:hypothetical protein